MSLSLKLSTDISKTRVILVYKNVKSAIKYDKKGIEIMIMGLVLF